MSRRSHKNKRISVDSMGPPNKDIQVLSFFLQTVHKQKDNILKIKCYKVNMSANINLTKIHDINSITFKISHKTTNKCI